MSLMEHRYVCTCVRTHTVAVFSVSHSLVQRGQFTITHGFDGTLLGAVTAGFSPVHSLREGLQQVRPQRTVVWCCG